MFSIAAYFVRKAEFALCMKTPMRLSCSDGAYAWLRDMDYIRRCSDEAATAAIAMNLQGSTFQYRVNRTARMHFLLICLAGKNPVANHVSWYILFARSPVNRREKNNREP